MDDGDAGENHGTDEDDDGDDNDNSGGSSYCEYSSSEYDGDGDVSHNLLSSFYVVYALNPSQCNPLYQTY